MQVIEAFHLTKKFGDKVALNGVNLSVEEGEIYGFIGPNGAGKSTFIKTMLNFIFPSQGTVKILGYDSVKQSAKIKKQVTYVSSEVRFYADMSGHELVRLTAMFHKIHDHQQKARYYCDLFEIDLRRKYGELSLGNKKKIALLLALIVEPKLLILDEPSGGLDPLMQHRLFQELRVLNQQGTTLFLSSHDLNEVQLYCSKAGFIREGKIVLEENISLKQHHSKIITLQTDVAHFRQIQTDQMKHVVIEQQNIQFIYDDNIQNLLQVLSHLPLKDLKIEDQTLESKFLSLYEGGTSDANYEN